MQKFIVESGGSVFNGCNVGNFVCGGFYDGCFGVNEYQSVSDNCFEVFVFDGVMQFDNIDQLFFDDLLL